MDAAALESWVEAIVKTPHQEHRFNLAAQEISAFYVDVSRRVVASRFFRDNEFVDRFQQHVEAHCPNCKEAFNGEQIGIVAAYQQAAGALTADEKLTELAKGYCPGSVSLYRIGDYLDSRNPPKFSPCLNDTIELWWEPVPLRIRMPTLATMLSDGFLGNLLNKSKRPLTSTPLLLPFSKEEIVRRDRATAAQVGLHARPMD